jgi:AcrR family transcriptional regulator
VGTSVASAEKEKAKVGLILEGTRREIERGGVVGLRILEVARFADCSVSLIYRYFRNRDELVACVLTHDFERNVEYWEELAELMDAESGPVDFDLIIERLQIPDGEASHKMRWSRVQTLAASVDNAVLRSKLSELVCRFQRATEKLVFIVARRNGVTITFDVSAFAQLNLSVAFMLVYNELLTPDEQLDDKMIRTFIRDLFERYLS